MKRNDKAIAAEAARLLIELFLDGSTTPAQEERLYRFYASHPTGSLPAELEPYRPMFAWYASLPRKADAKKRFLGRWGRYAAAAVVTAVATVGLLMAPKLSYSDNDAGLRARYDGSYIVRNGQRITDIDAILVSVMKAEQIADSLESLAMRQINDADINYEQLILEQSISEITDTILARELRDDLIHNKTLSKI